MRITFLTYFFLTLVLCNSLFLFQTQTKFFSALLDYGQWLLIAGNFILLITALFSVDRKNQKHFSYHDATVFQLLFFIMMICSSVMLLLLLLREPIYFMIFMPFEFFLVAFYIGFYFLLTRHVFPLKIKRIHV
ncbi:MAG: hypothetical protein COT25_00425 [Candidatus Kerfeldbacteria bacterium CG08_land_8_20_14_0_20_42_7]|uniref:Uncharacterized protein n=1 Tax=Candidatus Kerfeldbacteria bacterium CG08_land_8_20_14_0_20_42_7 TaxID=2014245 RepID=A0A2H0YW14_9BACT|nr:MAG: hypothetical protein COT25_00425 [Candidatus Kerfeldbacteria bacterium CG08_land_8_20_14_0_20_42_7]